MVSVGVVGGGGSWVEVAMVVRVGVCTGVGAGVGVTVAADVSIAARVEVGAGVGVGALVSPGPTVILDSAPAVDGEIGNDTVGVEVSPHPASTATLTNTLTISRGHMAQFYQTKYPALRNLSPAHRH